VFKFYRFIFYKLYKFCISIGRRDIPERKAVALLCLFVGLYLTIPYGILREFVFSNLSISKGVILAVFLLMCFIHFYFLILNNRYLRIYREFEKDKDYNTKHKWLIPVVLLLPFMIMLIFALTVW
jgi:SNF family Na+-dependent transporter